MGPTWDILGVPLCLIIIFQNRRINAPTEKTMEILTRPFFLSRLGLYWLARWRPVDAAEPGGRSRMKGGLTSLPFTCEGSPGCVAATSHRRAGQKRRTKAEANWKHPGSFSIPLYRFLGTPLAPRGCFAVESFPFLF